MKNDNSLYSYDINNGKLVSKTVYRDNGRVDRWDGINKPGYGHSWYPNGTAYGNGDKDPNSRPVGADPNRTWNDRDGRLSDKDKK